LGEMTTGGYTLLNAPLPKQKLVHIHSSAEELNRVYQADLAICATMNAAARSLEVLTAPNCLAWSEETKTANAQYRQWITPQSLPDLPFDDEGGQADANKLAGRINMPRIVKLLQQHLPPDAVLTNGAGNYASWMHRYFQHHGLSKGFKTQVAPTSGSMGVGVPAGVAAHVLTGRVAFTIAGDGDFLMTGQELSTATAHGAASIVLVLNNGTYGTIRMHQEREYPKRVLGSEIKGADFSQLARGYGYHGVRITHSDAFEAELLAALARLKDKQGTLIEIIISSEVITTRGSLSAITQQAITKKTTQR
jgi:acetolactate synthase I/II/III large subunit